jgi:hypothetical protein
MCVFGAPCYIHDMNHSSKFAPKAHEGFLLGYGSNSHTYRVYNSHHGKVMEMVNVRFDESNGSQKVHLANVIDEPSISEAIWQMAIGDVRPVKGNAHDSSDGDAPVFGRRAPQENATANAPPTQNANGEPNANADEEPEESEETDENGNVHPRVANRVDPALILEDLKNPGYRPTTRSRTRLANYCGSFSFVSLPEPT